MKRFFVLLFVLVIIKCNSQSDHLLKDKKYLKHWESYENCCIYEIDTGVFKGVFLDGKQLGKNDVFFVNITCAFFQIDSGCNTVCDYFCPTSSELDSICAKTCVLFKSGAVLKDFPCFKKPDFFCQYIGVLHNNRKMLLISFQRNKSTNSNKKISQKRFELFKLIYSRICFVMPLDSQTVSCDSFWMLYDIGNDYIVKILPTRTTKMQN